MRFKDKYFYSVTLLCVYFSLSYNSLYFIIQTPYYLFIFLIGLTEFFSFSFSLVSIFTNFLWCHVCFLHPLLYLICVLGITGLCRIQTKHSLTGTAEHHYCMSLCRPNHSHSEIEGGKETEKSMDQTRNLETLYLTIPAHRMYNQVQEKIRHSLKLVTMENLFLLFQIPSVL